MNRRTSRLTTHARASLTDKSVSSAPLAAVMCVCATLLASAQTTPPASGPATPRLTQQSDPLEGIASQIHELRVALEAIQQQLADSRKESDALRQELQAVRGQLDSLQRESGGGANPVPAESNETARIDAILEEQELLKARVGDQEQTKVESGSKHHVRLSALALLNVFSTRGSVDNIDLPGVAQVRAPGDSGGSFGAGVRQSLLNLEVFGPTLGGARTNAGLAFDFFGGFPSTNEGVSAPLIRLRTATFTLDWTNTSVVAGQDAPFFSPRSPTSLASTAYPALSAAGNMWTWTPQLYIEHRIALSNGSTLLVQGGILDPLTGELPREYDRMATAGERSRMPAQAVRFGWRRTVNERVVALGAGAYHANQDWGFGRTVDAWAATADWDVPLGRWFTVSGELYRGRAIAGLGAGASDSVLFDGPPAEPGSAVSPVESSGGWSQLKFKPVSRLEFNAAFGEDKPFQPDSSRFTIGSADGSSVNRNASGFLNAIYQARSNLLFSVEYRHLWTQGLDAVTRTADHVSLSTGIVF